MSQAKFIYIDFEFTDSHEEHLNLICCSLMSSTSKKMTSYWLQDEKGEETKKLLKKHLEAAREQGFIFVAYQVVAEARCFLTLGIDPVSCKWIDLHLEDKQLTNSNNEYGYGLQLIDGKVKKTKNISKWDLTEEELKKVNRDKPQRSLVACAFRFLRKEIDHEHKKNTVDIILRTRTGFTKAQKKRIITYCESDVYYLPDILKAMRKAYANFFYAIDKKGKAIEPHNTVYQNMSKYMLKRGSFNALTALQESAGYPVHSVWFQNFCDSTREIIKSCKIDVMTQFPDNAPFRFKSKSAQQVYYYENFDGPEPKKISWTNYNKHKEAGTLDKFYEISMHEEAVRNWITKDSGYVDNWLLTDTGNLSLSKDAWSKFFNFQHDYPRGNYPAQIIRYLKLKESMNGFMPNSKKKITDSYSKKDSRVRQYTNSYGAQSARSQQSASSFIPLKAAWTRSLMYQQDPTRFQCSIDYGSQEVLVAAILSGDYELYDSYASGDVYLAFAKKAGAVPEDGTKAEYKETRNLFKSTFLGISYGMQSASLARKLTDDTGKVVTQEKAQELIDKFYEVYHVYESYLNKVVKDYQTFKFLQLPCGWVLFGDNDNPRSFKNFMVQGAASSIMREAVKLCYDRGVKVLFTLHDALYTEISNPEKIQDFKWAMKQAFINVLDHEWCDAIRLDTDAWGEYFVKNGLQSLEDKTVNTYTTYIDERSQKDFEFFSPYFIKP